MADHLQQQILEAYQTTLLAASTAAGTNVFLERADELPSANLPALLIEGGAESVTQLTVGFPSAQQRTLQFTVTVVVAQASAAAKAARNLAGQVETALLATVAAATASSKAQSLRLVASEPDKDGSAATNMFRVRHEWEADYATQGGIPDTPF